MPKSLEPNSESQDKGIG